MNEVYPETKLGNKTYGCSLVVSISDAYGVGIGSCLMRWMRPYWGRSYILEGDAQTGAVSLLVSIDVAGDVIVLVVLLVGVGGSEGGEGADRGLVALEAELQGESLLVHTC